MHASLTYDPQHGPGYGIIYIYDIEASALPPLSLQRVSDGYYLAEGGWIAQQSALPWQQWQPEDNALKVWLGPSTIDNLSPAEKYILSAGAAGRCALNCQALYQSRISVDTSIYKNVEPTPEILSENFTPQKPEGI